MMCISCSNAKACIKQIIVGMFQNVNILILCQGKLRYYLLRYYLFNLFWRVLTAALRNNVIQYGCFTLKFNIH